MNAILIKIGGSLALHPEVLRSLCVKLDEATKQHKLIVLPGGGEFADTVRQVDKRFKLSAEASHRMAILAMDQFGFLISDLIKSSCVVNQLEEVQRIWNLNKLPIFLPSNLMLRDDPLANSWDVTSDSIAAYVASQLQIKKVVLITDVDGIYDRDPKKYSNAKLVEKISAKQLELMNQRTSVDKFLPSLLSQMKIQCVVVNGLYPNRVEAVLDGQKTICTLIDYK